MIKFLKLNLKSKKGKPSHASLWAPMDANTGIYLENVGISTSSSPSIITFFTNLNPRFLYFTFMQQYGTSHVNLSRYILKRW